MKLTHVIAVVIMLHLAVIGTLFVFPGCSDPADVGQIIRPQGDRGSPDTPFGEPPAKAQGTEEPTGYAALADSPESKPQLLPPTKPSWNIASDDDPELIVGEADYEETEFNAINPELAEVETVVVEEQVPTGLATQQTYTVKKGDNLTRIARSQGVSLMDLMAANNLNRDSIIRVDQTLIIPADSLAGPASPSAPAMSPDSFDQEGTPYEVQRGDTLGGIARRYGTTVSAIRGANGISGNTIYAGQTLMIPDGASGVPAPPPIPPAQEVSVGAGEDTYTVQSGDTLGAIAKRYGVTVRELAARNNISDPRKLRAGQTLIMPLAGSSATPAPVTPRTSSPAPVPAPVPAPSSPASVEEVQEDDVIDFENLDDIPFVPVESSE